MTTGVVLISVFRTHKHLVGTAAAVVAFGAVAAGTISAATAADLGPATTMAVRSPVVATPPATPVQTKQAVIARYGVYPLPVSERTVAEYHLGKKQLRDIANGNKLGNSAKGRHVRTCESGGDYKSVDNGYYGAWQFDRSTWLSNGGGKFAPTANRAPRWAQDYILYRTWKARGWSAWSCA